MKCKHYTPPYFLIFYYFNNLTLLFLFSFLYLSLSIIFCHFPSFLLSKTYPQIYPLIQSTKLIYPHSLKHHSFFNFSLYIFYPTLFLPLSKFSTIFFTFSLDNTLTLCYTLISQLRNPTKH